MDAENTEPADIERQGVMDAAWEIAKASPINVLSDMELLGARALPNGKVVGAWFGGSRYLGETIDNNFARRAFSFDIVVDPAHADRGIGGTLFKDALAYAEDGGDDCIALTVHAAPVAKMASRHGFKQISGTNWFRWNTEPNTTP